MEPHGGVHFPSFVSKIPRPAAPLVASKALLQRPAEYDIRIVRGQTRRAREEM